MNMIQRITQTLLLSTVVVMGSNLGAQAAPDPFQPCPEGWQRRPQELNSQLGQCMPGSLSTPQPSPHRAVSSGIVTPLPQPLPGSIEIPTRPPRLKPMPIGPTCLSCPPSLETFTAPTPRPAGLLLPAVQR